jgi:DNA helicase-2/ATP-dependent DNA helicase PcrA
MTQKSSIDYLVQLNDVQRQAVLHTEGPSLIVAGPGSGKTRVLTFRVARLIETGVAPWEIMALTFTNKAAREMKERIALAVGPVARQVWAGTFHSIFARILRAEASKIGYPSNFTVYDTEDTKSALSAIVREMALDKDAYNVNTLRARISSAKANLVTPKLYASDEKLLAQDHMANIPLFHQVYKKYVARCKRAGAMDFDDLLFRFFELLQANPGGVLEKYRARFRYLLVDEFQDTNFIQYAIVRRLANYEGSPRNICVVGDDAQSIYAFRGATIQNILDFEKDFKPYDIKIFKLEQNYRSTIHIVQAANEVITVNRRQIPKRIWSDKGDGHRIKIITALTDTEEGKRVVDTIVEQKNRFHLANRDIAILYRTNAQSRIFEEYLRRHNILYRIYGGLSFYQRKEVKDLVAYLRLAVNPHDEEALRRVINYPSRKIGDATVEKINLLAGQLECTMWEALPRVEAASRTRQAIAEFIALINDFGRWAREKNAFEAAEYIAEASGLAKFAKADKTTEGQGRVENLEALLNGIQAFVDEDLATQAEEFPDKSLATFLQHIALLTDLDEEGRNGEQDCVTLMSAHAAKGLEFKSVFIVGLEEKLFPSYLSMDTEEGLEEERRLFYVAVTRAEQFLTLSYAANRYRFGQLRSGDPSRFIREIPATHLAGAARLHREETPPAGAAVSGYFKPRGAGKESAAPAIDPQLFRPSPPEAIQAGMKVLHLKFGEGKVISIDGDNNNRVATIFFGALDAPEKRIMLRFAKLQILDNN